MKAKPLMKDQPVTQDGRKASAELLEIVQILAREVNALQGKLAAVAAVAPPSGGATVDSQSRAAITAVIAACA